jgi:hypothetical protein
MYGNKKGFANELNSLIAILVLVLFTLTGVLPIIWDVVYAAGVFNGTTGFFNGSVSILLQQIPLFIVIGLIVIILSVMLGR